MAQYPTRLWATRDVDGSVVLVQDGAAGIRSVAFHDPFAADTYVVDGQGLGKRFTRTYRDGALVGEAVEDVA